MWGELDNYIQILKNKGYSDQEIKNAMSPVGYLSNIIDQQRQLQSLQNNYNSLKQEINSKNEQIYQLKNENEDIKRQLINKTTENNELMLQLEIMRRNHQNGSYTQNSQ